MRPLTSLGATCPGPAADDAPAGDFLFPMTEAA